MQTFSGIPASPGYALGKVHRIRKKAVVPPRRSITAAAVAAERERFDRAVARAKRQLTPLVAKLEDELGPEEAEILSSQLLMLEDEMVVGRTRDLIASKLVNAEAAFSRAIGDIVLRFHEIQEETFRERIDDLRDLEERVLLAFIDGQPDAIARPREPSIICARNLAPSETAVLGRDHVLGFLIDEGGSTSHVR